MLYQLKYLHHLKSGTLIVLKLYGILPIPCSSDRVLVMFAFSQGAQSYTYMAKTRGEEETVSFGFEKQA
jgi:hypothetical protein